MTPSSLSTCRSDINLWNIRTASLNLETLPMITPTGPQPSLNPIFSTSKRIVSKIQHREPSCQRHVLYLSCEIQFVHGRKIKKLNTSRKSRHCQRTRKSSTSACSLWLKNKSRQVLSTVAQFLVSNFLKCYIHNSCFHIYHTSRNETKRPEVQIDLKWSWPRNRSSKTVIKALSKETKEWAMPKWLERKNKQPGSQAIYQSQVMIHKIQKWYLLTVSTSCVSFHWHHNPSWVLLLAHKHQSKRTSVPGWTEKNTYVK